MIEVFKTNVQELNAARELIQCLSQHFLASKITFDLEDCDKVLRVEGTEICPNKVMELVMDAGYACDVME